MGKKTKTTTKFRSAETGKFLKPEQAQRLPKNEVVKERVPKSGYGDTK
jgi:hypothetical protein